MKPIQLTIITISIWVLAILSVISVIGHCSTLTDPRFNGVFVSEEGCSRYTLTFDGTPVYSRKVEIFGSTITNMYEDISYHQIRLSNNMYQIRSTNLSFYVDESLTIDFTPDWSILNKYWIIDNKLFLSNTSEIIIYTKLGNR